MSENGNNNNAGAMLGGFVVGAVVGAAVALIFAPMTGDETRRRIGSTARKLQDGAQGHLDNVTSAIKDTAGDVGAAIDAGKQAFRRNSDAEPAVKDRA